MLWKYLKDQGGQFWGAFAQSYANAVEKSRDRPLKEAMMKAQIGHQNAVTDKLNMDIQQARQHEQALTDLSNMLQPKESTTYTNPTAGLEATNYGETNPPTQEPDYGKTTALKMPNIKSPEVQGALIKAQPKEAATQLLKQSMAQDLTNVAVGSWAEARKLSEDPEFQAANPYGGRWEATPKGIMFKGIHPVNPEAATFHRSPEQGGGEQGALNYVEKRGATSSAANVAGKAGQQLNEPIQPVMPMPGRQGNAPVGQPNVSATPNTNAPAGESPAMRAKRQQQQITRQEGPLPEADKNALNAASKISAQADLLLKGFSEDEINKFSGVINQPKSKAKAYGNAIGEAVGIGKPFDEGTQNRFSAWQTALGQLKHVAFDEGGKQLTPFEASIVFSYIPTGSELNGGVEIRQKIDQLKAFLEGGRQVRAKLAASGRANVDPVELDKIMQEQLTPLVQKLRAGQPGGQGASAGQNVINYNGKKYIKQNGALFEVRE